MNYEIVKSTDHVDVLNVWDSNVYSRDVHLQNLVFHNIHLLPFLFNLIYLVFYVDLGVLCFVKGKAGILLKVKVWVVSGFILNETHAFE